MFRKLALIGAVGALSLAMVGCGDDDAPAAAAPAAFLTGTAAVGAPIVGGTVTVDCAGTVQDLEALTLADGTYTIASAAAAAAGALLPCAVRITGGTPAVTLFSLAQTGHGNVVNITPLTNLVAARAVVGSGAGTDLVAWFNANADFTQVTQAEIDAAVADTWDALHTATGTTGIPFYIFTGRLVAGSTSNTYDVWLDAFQTALDASTIASYEALLSSFANGGTTFGFSFLPPVVSGTLTINVCSTVPLVGQRCESSTRTTPVPATQGEFCNAWSGSLALPHFTLDDCVYANNVGTITGTVTPPLPAPQITVPYTVTLTWAD